MTTLDELLSPSHKKVVLYKDDNGEEVTVKIKSLNRSELDTIYDASKKIDNKTLEKTDEVDYSAWRCWFVSTVVVEPKISHTEVKKLRPGWIEKIIEEAYILSGYDKRSKK